MTDLHCETDIAPLRRYFEAGNTRPLEWRRRQLEALARMGAARETEIFAALKEDLGKSAFESFASEVSFVRHGADYARKHLRRWMRPRRVPIDLPNMPGRARIIPEPLGVALIISPWNYPYHLALAPLVGALAGGNCAVLKPSEMTPATSALLARIVPEFLDPQAVRVVEGDAEVAQALLAQRFDHVFFTGSTRVGEKVMTAASRHLTPVTLELGGKSPVILSQSADIDVAARRVAWGKCLNAGQTCIAPDYVLAERGTAAPFIAAVKQQVQRFLGEDPQESPDYTRIVNTHHFDRLTGLLSDTEIVYGGQCDRDDLYIAPTIITNPPADAPIMSEEIFGPILPVIEVDDIDAALGFITSRPKPLALYLFSTDRAERDRVIVGTTSGGVVINDVVMHVTPPALPFGGVGASGMGRYHGRASFDTFSHLKPVLSKPNWGEVPLRYPPYSATKLRWLRRLL